MPINNLFDIYPAYQGLLDSAAKGNYLGFNIPSYNNGVPYGYGDYFAAKSLLSPMNSVVGGPINPIDKSTLGSTSDMLGLGYSTKSLAEATGMGKVPDVNITKGQVLMKNIGNTIKGAAPAIGGALNPVLFGLADHGYDTGGVGQGISGVGNVAGQVVGQFNPILGGAISAGSGLLGGLYNHSFGTKWNKEGIANINKNISSTRSVGYGLGDTNVAQDVIDAAGNIHGVDFTKRDVGKKGWLASSGKLNKKYNTLVNKANSAKAYATNAFINAAHNVDRTTDDIAEMNSGKYGTSYAAYGGLLNMGNNDMGALDYGFKMDFLNHLNNKDQANNKIGNPSSMGGTLFNPFALGGVMQSHGADWSTGATHINAGGMHEENPNEGVPMGMDNEGTPNVVEEGEVIVNDYVFSDRIYCDAETKKMFHISKKRKITFADLAKRLEKEVAERPNDPISKASFNRQIAKLQEQQERQKAEAEEAEERVAFDQMSPEEQVAYIQQMNAQQQAQQQTMQQPSQEEMMAAQQQMGNIPPEAMAQMQQQQASPEEMAQQQMMDQQLAQMAAYGGRLNRYAGGGYVNRFDDGGKIKQKIYDALGILTQDDYDTWMKDNDVAPIEWDSYTDDEAGLLQYLLGNENFMKALAKKSPALANSMKRGYDYGLRKQEYEEGKNFVNTPIKWGLNTPEAFWGALDEYWNPDRIDELDPMFKEAFNKGLINKDMTMDQLEKALMGTDSWKNTTEWLKKDPENMRRYLNELLKYDVDTLPQGAKDWAHKFINDEGNWINPNKIPTYDEIFGVKRHTYPGNYWKTFLGATGADNENRFIINADGTVTPIIGTVPKDWKSEYEYSWIGGDNAGQKDIYYKRPAGTPAAKEEEKKKTEAGEIYQPVMDPLGQYRGIAGLASTLAPLVAQGFSIGKPLYRYNQAIAPAKNVRLAGYQPIASPYKYIPQDTFFPGIQNAGIYAAANRNIMNNSAPQGSANASLVNAAYNAVTNNGDLNTKVAAANDEMRRLKADQIAKIAEHNSREYDTTSQFNANAMNQAMQHYAGLALNAEAQNANDRAGWYNSIYRNIGNVGKFVNDITKEANDWNKIAELMAAGVFGDISDKNPMAGGLLVPESQESERNKKLRTRRGLLLG